MWYRDSFSFGVKKFNLAARRLKHEIYLILPECFKEPEPELLYFGGFFLMIIGIAQFILIFLKVLEK